MKNCVPASAVEETVRGTPTGRLYILFPVAAYTERPYRLIDPHELYKPSPGHAGLPLPVRTSPNDG